MGYCELLHGRLHGQRPCSSHNLLAQRATIQCYTLSIRYTGPLRTHLHFFPVHFHGLDHEIDPNSCALTWWKQSLRKPPDQARLAHARVAHQHHFKEKLVVFHRNRFTFVEILLIKEFANKLTKLHGSAWWSLLLREKCNTDTLSTHLNSITRSL